MQFTELMNNRQPFGLKLAFLAASPIEIILAIELKLYNARIEQLNHIFYLI
jgi:hypothetical protein